MWQFHNANLVYSGKFFSLGGTTCTSFLSFCRYTYLNVLLFHYFEVLNLPLAVEITAVVFAFCFPLLCEY